jgi:cell division protein FtsI (penicillin-binding protein 3)
MKNRRQGKRPAPSQPNLPGLQGSPEAANPPNRLNRLTTPGEFALDRAKQRLGFLVLVFGILFLVIVGRLGDLMLFNEAQEGGGVSRIASGAAPLTSRADIVDRYGTVLATSLPTVTLTADPHKILNANEAIAKMKSVLPDLDAKKLAEDFQAEKHLITIRRHLTPHQYYELNKLGIAGLEFEPDEGRIYPSGALTAHVLGYTDIDDTGIAGIEKSQNDRLEENQDPLVLSLDLRLQEIMHRELSLAMQDYHALGAAGLIMDATTGEILSLVSLPDFDPQHAGAADDDAKFNRATLGVYEMGSTFKLFNTALALDSGLIRPADRFDTTHAIEVGHQWIRDYHPANHNLNVAEILMVSSNIGSARMAEKVGSARQRAFLARLGLTEKAPLELPEVGPPLIPSASNWSDATTMTVAFGHGVAVNAVQLVSAAASILNDGISVRPTLLKVADQREMPKNRVVSLRTSMEMRALMRLVVKGGTGKSAEVQGYVVGGKTGTADKLSGKRYSENARLSSFLGVFPANAPRYLVFALLDDPKGTAKTYGFATGGWTAAPVVGHVISQIGPLLDLPPMEHDVTVATERQLLRTLGNEVLESLHMETDTNDYASAESNGTR